ncbi:MAG: PD-(D/E)XK nuclease-like domain-containing protein [Magnetospiraceae bacterium]
MNAPSKRRIIEPGIYDLPSEVYHADPVPGGSLSSSGARKLLIEPFGGCPAKFKYERDNPPEPKAHFDFGHVVHRLVLGKGEAYSVIDAADWRGKATKEAGEAARAAGKVPILAKDFARCEAMADQVRKHDFAGALFQAGKAEQSLFWRDDFTGVMCRAMLDWLPEKGAIFADYKTCADASPDAIAKALDNLGYYLQAAWYLEGIEALGIVENPTFLFVFQEKEPPHLVTVVQPEAGDLVWGRIVAKKARLEFAKCLRDDHWPGYAEDVIKVGMPHYAHTRLEKADNRGAFQVAMDMQAPLNAAE